MPLVASVSYHSTKAAKSEMEWLMRWFELVNKSVAPPLTSKLLPEKIVGDENMS
jgi:hypothetical protein